MGYIAILTVLLTSCSGLNQNRFVCRGEKTSRPVIYSYGENGIMLNDFYEYHVWRSKPEPLTAKDKGGSYRLNMGEESIVLEYIQDTVLVAYKNPAGKIVKEIGSIKSPRKFARVRRYHAIFPSFNEYVFDKQKATLTVHNTLMHPSRRIIEQKFTPKGKPRLVKVLSSKDAATIFPPRKLSVSRYPHCRQESRNIVKSLGRFLRQLF